MRRTETEVKEVRIIDTLGPKGKEPGTGQRRRAGCPCPGLGSCVGWGMNEGSPGGAGCTPLEGGGIVAAPVQEWTPVA